MVREHLRRWLLHRSGQQSLDSTWPNYFTRALELNKGGHDFTETFGRSDVRALVGFVDLIGFSSRVRGAAPSEIARYAVPFLRRVANAVLNYDALVDKTIGDEVMFVLPDVEAEGGVPLVLAAYYLMRQFQRLRDELAPEYRFRIGSSLGIVHVAQVVADEYSEWSVFGESVNFAKRITDVSSQDSFADMGAWGAIGVLNREPDCHPHFDALLRYFPSSGVMATDLTMREVSDPIPLKGISDYRCALLVARSETGGE